MAAVLYNENDGLVENRSARYSICDEEAARSDARNLRAIQGARFRLAPVLDKIQLCGSVRMVWAQNEHPVLCSRILSAFGTSGRVQGLYMCA